MVGDGLLILFPLSRQGDCGSGAITLSKQETNNSFIDPIHIPWDNTSVPDWLPPSASQGHFYRFIRNRRDMEHFLAMKDVLCTLPDALQFFATHTLPPIFLTMVIARELFIF